MKNAGLIVILIFLSLGSSKSQNLSFSGGSGHSVSLCADGHVYAAGNNSKGSIGQGIAPFTSPIIQYAKVKAGAGTDDGSGFLTGIRQVDAGSGSHSIALGCTGNLYTWGWNVSGALGINNTTDQGLPQKVLTGEQGDASGFLTGAIFISGGNLQSYAVLSNGDLMGWGENSQGAVGCNATGADVLTPKYVRKCDGTKLTNVIQVDAGDDFGVALLADGTVWAWGNNSGMHYSLGQGNSPSNSGCALQVKGPAGVGFLSNITKITAGDTHVLALADDGTVWGWGGDWDHQLCVSGSGPGFSDIYYPTKVVTTSTTGPNLANIIDISAGNNFSIALKSDGTVWTWGGNSFGQLGRATSDYPQQVPGLTNIVGVSEGDHWSFAIDNTGAIYEFGENGANGFLGLNTTTGSYASPTLVTTLPCTAALSCPDASLPSAITVCSNPNVSLNAGSLGSTYTYQWKLNGLVIPGATSATYTATGTGTYRVVISDATLRGCGLCPKDSDQVVISSTANATAMNPNYCTLPSNLNFCVSGPSGSNYDWYSALTGGSKLNGAASNCYSATVASVPTVYYAQDLATYRYYTGYSFGNAIFGATSASSDYYTNAPVEQYFDVLSTMILDTVTVRVTGGAAGAWTFTVAVKDNGGTQVGASTVVSTSGNGTMTIVVPLGPPTGITIPPGNGYYLDIIASSSSPNFYAYHMALGSGVIPVGVTGVISLVSNPVGAYAAQYYGAFYDWKIRGGNPCGRVPVQAVQNCSAPVELLEFNGQHMGNYNLLSWTTAHEVNANLFYILRSLDGINFEIIGQVPASGKEGINHYTYTDYTSASGGTVYYQLKEVDHDGLSMSSEVIKLSQTGDLDVHVWPNPSDKGFHFNVFNPDGEEINIRVFNLEGKLLFENSFTSSDISLGDTFAPGIYFATVSSQSEHKTLKIIKTE